MRSRYLPILAAWAVTPVAFAVTLSGREPAPLLKYESSESERVERQVEPPAFPKEADLVEFYVSSNSANHFYIDKSTLSDGSDGIVRYVLVVKTAGGATNTTFEGIRCQTGEYKIYALGRADGTWARARIDEWRPIENKLANRHHAALNRELFCPGGAAITSADEGRDALRRGKHPLAP
jgi:hypothetical protein